jgi:hypothetical protein
MCVENDVAVHAAFRGKMTTFGETSVVGVEPFYKMRYRKEVFPCLHSTESFNTPPKDFCQMFFVIEGSNYFF